LQEHNYSQNFLTEIYPHYNYFVKVATRLTRDEDDAKDLVQETYIRAFRFFDTYEKDTNPKAWVYRILKNLFINYTKKKQKDPYSLSNYETLDSHSWYSMVDDEKQMSDEFIVAINSIKDEYRMVIILYHLEDYSIEDIANFLGCPVGTVKSRLYRARRILKTTIMKIHELG
jgi:RNA polymerase sigma-70 factor (ECF subfamily)